MRSLLFITSLLVLPLQAQAPEALPGQAAAEPAAQEAPAPSTPATTTVGDPLHPAIAVLPIRGQAAQGFGNPSDDIYQRVTASFFKTKRFTLIERAQLGAVLAEGKNQNSVAFDDASAVALGKQLGAKVVVVGSYTATMSQQVDTLVDKSGARTTLVTFPASVLVSLRLVDVETGHINDTIEAKGTAREPNSASSVRVGLEDLARKLGREVGNHFPVTGFVIKVLDPKQAVIDLGRNEGVGEKDEFLVFERGEDIIHPITGKIIKGEKKLISEFKVVSVAEDSAIVKLTGSTVALKPGLALESKPKKRGLFEAINDTIFK